MKGQFDNIVIAIHVKRNPYYIASINSVLDAEDGRVINCLILICLLVSLHQHNSFLRLSPLMLNLLVHNIPHKLRLHLHHCPPHNKITIILLMNIILDLFQAIVIIEEEVKVIILVAINHNVNCLPILAIW